MNNRHRLVAKLKKQERKNSFGGITLMEAAAHIQKAFERLGTRISKMNIGK